MIRISQISIFVLALGVFILGGCRSRQTRADFLSDIAAGVVRSKGGPPVFIYIPFPTDRDYDGGFPAQIALPIHREYTTNLIEVYVGGEVLSPSRLQVPKGSTVLQAISYAGEFTDFAATRRLRIVKASGETVRLFLRWRRVSKSRYRHAWYDKNSDESNVRSKKSSPASISDYILETGDRITVSRSGT